MINIEQEIERNREYRQYRKYTKYTKYTKYREYKNMITRKRRIMKMKDNFSIIIEEQYKISLISNLYWYIDLVLSMQMLNSCFHSQDKQFTHNCDILSEIAL